MKKILAALLLAFSLAIPASAAEAFRPIMPAPFFDLVCAGATISCTLLSPTFSGTATFTGQALFADGTAALPGIAFASQPGMGIYRLSANQMFFNSAAN